MTREFIYTNNFSKKWVQLGLDDDDLLLLEIYLLEKPNAGDVMEGTGGIRKLRWALPNKGKSSGIRILYVDFIFSEIISMFDLFSKDEKDNLSKVERNALKQIVKAVGEELKK